MTAVLKLFYFEQTVYCNTTWLDCVAALSPGAVDYVRYRYYFPDQHRLACESAQCSHRHTTAARGTNNAFRPL